MNTLIPAVRSALLTALLLAGGMAMAQQRPLTGQMLGDTPAAPVPPAPVSTHLPPAPATPALQPLPASAALAVPLSPKPQIGDTTRALLQLQASGSSGGERLPILGDQASLSYARYLQSFSHPIPEFLDTSVRKQVSGDGNGE